MWTVLISKLWPFFGQIAAISFCECILLTRTPRVSNLQIVFSTEAMGSYHMRKTVKKADNVRFGRPPKTGKKRTFVV